MVKPSLSLVQLMQKHPSPLLKSLVSPVRLQSPLREEEHSVGRARWAGGGGSCCTGCSQGPRAARTHSSFFSARGNRNVPCNGNGEEDGVVPLIPTALDLNSGDHVYKAFSQC